MMKYQMATNDHAMNIKHSAIGTNNNHFKVALSLSVIFQIRAADPENDVGAETTIFSNASFSFIIVYISFYCKSQLSGLDFA